MTDFNKHPGAPIPDALNPMTEGVGAASFTPDRRDSPDLTLAGEPKIQPMSILDGWHVDENDPDPHGMTIHGADGEAAGTVSDLWVDRSEPTIRYLQMNVAAGAPVLVPMGFCRVTGNGIHVKALKAAQFNAAPRPRATDRITLLEEDRIFGYFAGGYRYAEPDRLEPLL